MSILTGTRFLSDEIGYLVVVNLMAFLAYGIDKYSAKKSGWRIPENTLIALAIAGGPFGCYLGMRIFHHKTRKAKFKIVIPLLCIVWILVVAWAETLRC